MADLLFSWQFLAPSLGLRLLLLVLLNLLIRRPESINTVQIFDEKKEVCSTDLRLYTSTEGLK
jgi:hypothetical protein